MNSSTYITLSGQNAWQREMDVLANNIANLSTPGFKGEQMLFNEYLVDTPDGKPLSYVAVAGTARDMNQGPLTHTGNPLDIALDGPGFLAVTKSDGSTEYTRDGHLQLDSKDELVTSTGFVVQGSGGAPIVIPAGAGRVTIGNDGTVSTRQGTIGKIAVVNFADPQVLVESQGGLYTTSQAAQPITTTQVEQGTIEQANVQPILEMTRLMSVAHSITLAKNFADGENTLLTNAIDRLGKTI